MAIINKLIKSFQQTQVPSLISIHIDQDHWQLTELQLKNSLPFLNFYALIKPLDNSYSMPKTDAITAIPDPEAITKLIPLSKPPVNLNSFILNTLAQLIEPTQQSWNFDYQLLKNNQLLLVAAQTDIINQRRNEIKKAGFNLTIIDLESHAIERACHYFFKNIEQPYALILLESTAIKFY